MNKKKTKIWDVKVKLAKLANKLFNEGEIICVGDQIFEPIEITDNSIVVNHIDGRSIFMKGINENMFHPSILTPLRLED